MSRRFTYVTVALTALVAFLVGAIFAGGLMPSSAVMSGSPKVGAVRPSVHTPAAAPVAASVISFADIVERINPAVVNIDATSRGRDSRPRRSRTGIPDPPDLFDGPFDFGTPRRESNAPH